MADIHEDCASYNEMLEKFNQYFQTAKEQAENVKTITHMGMIVEAELWRDMHKQGIIGDWDTPYFTIDACSYSEISDSIDSYNKANGITINPADYAEVLIIRYTILLLLLKLSTLWKGSVKQLRRQTALRL